MKGIITADWHVRAQRPRCRRDEDWLETQRQCIRRIVDAVNERECDLYIVGDIFHTSRQPHEVVNMVIDELNKIQGAVFIMPGNHDLANHNHDNESRSAYGILKRYFKELHHRESFVYDIPADPVLFIHELTFPDEKSRPMENCGLTAEDMLDKYPNAEYIFTGDYHHHFKHVNNGRYVINPGCINIQTADQIYYEPCIYFLNTLVGYFEHIPIPDNAKLITDEYIQEENERNERIEAFVSMVKSKGEVGLDFLENLKGKLNGLKENTREVIDEILSELEG